MSDSWREGGKLVKAEWNAFRQGPVSPILAETENKLRNGQLRPSFLGAAIAWIGRERNPKLLIDLLRSDVPITREDRENLAEAIERAEIAPFKKPKGRPKKHDLHEAALVAQQIFKRWRYLNAERGIDDYGHRSEMMDESIELAKKYAIGTKLVDVEAIRDLLQRPASRRN